MCLLFEDVYENEAERHAYPDFTLLTFDYSAYWYRDRRERIEEDLAKYQAWYAVNVSPSIDELKRRKMVGLLARNMKEALRFLDELPVCEWPVPRRPSWNWPKAEPRRRRSLDGTLADELRDATERLKEKKRERFERERLARTLRAYEDSSRECSPMPCAQRPKRYFENGEEDRAREDWGGFEGQAQEPIWIKDLLEQEIIEEEEREDDMLGEQPDLRAYEAIEEWTPPRPPYSPITPPSVVVETAEKTLKRKRRLFESASKSTEAAKRQIIRYPTKLWTQAKHDEHVERLTRCIELEEARAKEMREAEEELEGAKLVATIDFTTIGEEQWDDAKREDVEYEEMYL